MINTMFTSLLPKGRARPEASQNAPQAGMPRNAFAHQRVTFGSAQAAQPDQFIKRASNVLRFAGDDDSAKKTGGKHPLTSKIKHANDIAPGDKNGNTWMHYAALAGEEELAKQLLEDYKDTIDLTLKNKQDLTAYTACATSGKAKIAELLRDKGAKLQIFQKGHPIATLFPGQDLVHPSDLAKKLSKDQNTIQFFLKEEKKALEEILSKP